MTTPQAPARRAFWLDARNHPATWALSALWIAVYLGMCWDQGSLKFSGNFLTGGISIPAAHDFGDMTSVEIHAGQTWRALTATCVHFGLLHIGLNLIGLTQLGRAIEQWYGSAQLLVLYVVIGGLGNILATVAKLWRGDLLNNPSGGGSGVLCGLLALVAVVGWKSATTPGRTLAKRMLSALGATALLGYLVPQVDNYGHAGGAIVGALIGLFDKALARHARTRPIQILGAVALAILVASGVIQYRYARAEHLYRSQARVLVSLEGLRVLFREEAIVYGRFPSLDRRMKRRMLQETVRSLDREPEVAAETDDDLTFRRMLRLASAASTKRPTPGEIRGFESAWRRVTDKVRRDIALSAERLSSFRIIGPGPVQLDLGRRNVARRIQP